MQVYFNVYNDGVGGTAAMFLDDIVLQACSGGPVASQTPVPCATSTPACSTPSATPLATATCTVAPTATKTPACGVTPTCVTPAASPTPAITYTPVPPGCTQSLVHNGGFESGLLPWRRGADLLPATIVSDPVSEGAYAVRLGSQTENYNTFSSIRQTVTVPWGYPRALVSFRAYPWAESLTGHDIQQFVVLGTDDSIWGVPWRVLEDAPDWQWYVFDLVGGTGQTFDLYFNAYNDGEGGRTALFVDDVQMWGCTPGEYPDELLAAGVTVYNGAGATAVVPIPPGGREQVATTLTPWGEMTRVAIDLTKESYVGLNLTPGAEATPRPADTRIAPTSTRGAATATSVTATPTPGPTAPSLPDRLRDLWQRIKDWWNRVRTLRTLVK